MQIHVVEPGQTLFTIAQRYSVPPDLLTRSNELTAPGQLVVGQTIVIPIQGSYYWVQPGDSLFTIARRFGTSAQALASINGIPIARPLQVGFRLYIPEPPKRRAEFNAYLEPSSEGVVPALSQEARKVGANLTYMAPFSFQIQRDATLKPPLLDQFPDIAKENGVTLMMVVTNLENGQFSPELGELILNNLDIQNKLLDNVIATAKQYGFRDIHFDIEHLRPVDREAYNRFLRRAAERIHKEGYLMSTALAPKTSAAQQGEWYTAHDYKAHGQISDFVIIMTYEWGYSGGPAMPVSPIGPVRQVLEYAITEMPANKIMMGQNMYGYDWTLPYVPGGKYAHALSPQDAIDLAREQNVAIEYDSKAQAPHFNYRDQEGKDHVVWFEDARSIQAKFNLLKELGLRGVSYWKLGLPFPQNWLLIQDNFQVVKK
jgi:spore germination protein